MRIELSASMRSMRSAQSFITKDLNLSTKYSISALVDSSVAQKPTIPVGLVNLRNTCYLNSVLQCLIHTPPLAEYCLRHMHSTICTHNVGDCTFCILEEQICSSLDSSQNRVIAPRKLHDRLMANSNYFRPGRQEDAHELLHFLINDCGNGLQSREKSVLEGMFGGVMQRDIECRSCGEVSTSREDMLGLSLDINDLSTVSEAFASFFRPEVLDGENKYKCDGCSNYCVADIRMSIHRAPRVLTIQLKRFDYLSNKKLNHHVRIEGRLSLRNHMTTLPHDHVCNKFTANAQYELYGVIVHRGFTMLYGHYYAYVKKESNGQWIMCNDENVSQVSEEQVLASNAYLLFYGRLPSHNSSIILECKKMRNIFTCANTT